MRILVPLAQTRENTGKTLSLFIQKARTVITSALY